ncbi:Protein insensitive [Eumeta japonica]|uniref:Protein insensitive n=1 Tax=Eumeta variegata TaxID=151549 RepID=A0A4C1UWH0_EUMVA|nr:Protein insensitive [Eumeta japonica]
MSRRVRRSNVTIVGQVKMLLPERRLLQSLLRPNPSPNNKIFAKPHKKMVPIGTGTTLVPKEVYSKINWKSYTMATRKLLIAVFSRRTLATHSLTGKASPAFLSKPAKLCLYPEKVADIVMTVTDNCYVRENLIRYGSLGFFSALYRN